MFWIMLLKVVALGDNAQNYDRGHGITFDPTNVWPSQSASLVSVLHAVILSRQRWDVRVFDTNS